MRTVMIAATMLVSSTLVGLCEDVGPVDTFEARWDSLHFPINVRAHGSIVPRGQFIGPFMMAADPLGVITNSPVPLMLYPEGWFAMAKGELPHICPQPTNKTDKDECQ